MTTLAEPAVTALPVAQRESGGWGLLLIPILLCLGMLTFGFMSSGLSSEAPPPTSRACANYEPGPTNRC